MAKSKTLQPLDQFPADARKAIRGVLTDIDDTLTTDGRLTAEAYSAMQALQRANFLVIPITGRPAGWCDHIARMWPVDAVVGENGAFYFHYDRTACRMTRRFDQSAEERAENRTRLAAIRDQILSAVPGAAVASDQPYRETDLAIDFCEDVPALPIDAVDRIVSVFEAAGATAKISSIHVNGWFGNFDKLTMARRLMAEIFDTDLDRDQAQFVFTGDAPNDAPMFGFFDHAVGVANVMDFRERLAAEPAFITGARGGAGFAELATALLEQPRNCHHRQ
ncbi:MAG: HAD-IIB family hydrolase [Alphaproteobacteria bacterium]|nr:HAD-IIB family hydrolase [Alphaproteobacteria bacterium]